MADDVNAPVKRVEESLGYPALDHSPRHTHGQELRVLDDAPLPPRKPYARFPGGRTVTRFHRARFLATLRTSIGHSVT